MIANLDIYNFKEDEQEDDSQIISDLKNSEQKKINSKHFYDERSKLFDKISNLKSIIQLEQNLKLLKNKNTRLKTIYHQMLQLSSLEVAQTKK